MAESRQTTGAVHLTKLDLDISGITSSLNTAKEQIENFGNEIPRVISTSLDSAGQEDLLQKLGITNNNIEEAKAKLESLARQMEKLGEYQNISISSKGGNLFRAVITYSDEAGRSIQRTVDLTKDLEQGLFKISSSKVTDNYAKQIEEQNKKAQQAIEGFYRAYETELSREEKVEKETYRAIEQRTSALEKQERQMGQMTQAEKEFIAETERSQQSALSSLNSLGNGYESLAKKIQESTISEEYKKEFLSFISDVETKIAGLKIDISQGFGLPEGTDSRIYAISTAYDKLTASFNDMQVAQKEAEQQQAKLEKEIERTTSELASYEKRFQDLEDRITRSKIDEEIKTALIDRIEQAKGSIDGFRDSISKNLSLPSDLPEKYNEFDNIIKSIKNDFISAKDASGEFSSALKKIESMKDSIMSLSVRLSTSKLGADEKNFYADEIIKLYDALEALQGSVEKGVGDPSKLESDLKKISAEYKEISEAIRLSIGYKDQFDSISSKINSAVKALDSLERQAGRLGDSKQKVSELRKEYERLAEEADEIYKTGDAAKISIFLSEARDRLGSLGKEFDTLSSKIKNGDGLLSDFLTKLADKAKWYVAFQAMNLLQNAFGNVINTIKDTEDAVIEIQRVLNDPSLADSTVSQRIYDIAYSYGQTFENVQEVFTRFAQAGLDFEQATKATEAAMLGLNTAELDVSTATQGLIAIMAQFGYTADDLTMIIDKINITADNFAVTSEKIVAGLQRAGGTASAFGLTLEETIGIITALSEATGRSGEQIGTALNSLITFSEKSSSLKLFREFLGTDVSDANVLQVWTMLSEKIQGGSEALAQFMSEHEEFSAFLNEDLVNALGLQEEYNQALAEEKDVIGAVGTYRQNYFIALLKNISTAIEAIKSMNEAEGYSMSENEKAMDRLTAQWNQLVVAAQELAVQFGEAGFLQLLKWLADAATGVLKLTKDFGGLRTALIGLIGLLITVKSTKITEMLSNWRKGFSGLGGAFTALKVKILSYKTSVDAATTSQEINALAMQGAVAGIGLLTMAISGIIGLYSAWKTAMDERADAAYEEAKATSNQAKEVADLIVSYRQSETAYEEGKTSKDNLNSATEALVKKLKDEGIIVEELSGDYEELKGKIDDVLESVSEEQVAAAGRAADDAADRFVKAFNDSLSGGVVIPVKLGDVSQFGQDVDTQLMGLLREIDGLTTKATIGLLGQGMTYSLALESQIKTIDDAVNAYKALLEAKKTVVDYYGPEIAGTTEIYKQIDNQIVSIKGAYEEYEWFKNQLKEIEDAYNGVIPEIEEFTENLENSENAITISEEAIEYLEGKLKSVSEAYSEVEGKLSGLQSAYGTLISAVDEYNDTGVMTSEMLEKLLQLEPEYLELLEVKNGQLSLNKDGVDGLVESTDIYMQQLVALRIAEEAEQFATELQAAATNHLTVEEFKAQVATLALGDEIYIAALNMIQGTGTAEDFSNAIFKVGEAAALSGEYLGLFAERVGEIFGTYAGLLTTPRSFTLPSSSYKPASSGGSSSSSAEKKKKEALQSELKSYQELEKAMKEYYSNEQKEIEDTYNTQIKAIEDSLNANKKYYGGLTEELKDSAIEEFKSILTASKKTYEDISVETAETRRAEIDGFNSSLNAAEDYYRNLHEITLDDLGDILEATKDHYKNLEDVVKAYYQTRIDLAKEAVEAEEKGSNEQIEALKERLESEKSSYESKKKNAEDYYNSLIESLRNVQEENDRINAQLDYYQNRQKIITNIEQAQSRSGVEWREKEMEYQQQLIDLDEDWRRTQEDWAVEDRVEELERLKQAAIESIESAFELVKKQIESEIDLLSGMSEERINALETEIDELEKEREAELKKLNDELISKKTEIETELKQKIIDAENQIDELKANRDAELEKSKAILDEETAKYDALIAGVQSKIDALSSSTASSISGGISGGVASGTSYAFESIQGLLARISSVSEQTSQEETYRWQRAREKEGELLEKQRLQFEEYSREISTKIPDSAASGATQAMNRFKENLILPLQKGLLETFKQADTEADKIKTKMSTITGGMTKAASNITNSINMYNNISNTASANAAVNNSFGRLNSFR